MEDGVAKLHVCQPPLCDSSSLTSEQDSHLCEEVCLRRKGFSQAQGMVSLGEKLFYFKSNTTHEEKLFGSVAQKGHYFFKNIDSNSVWIKAHKNSKRAGLSSIRLCRESQCLQLFSLPQTFTYYFSLELNREAEPIRSVIFMAMYQTLKQLQYLNILYMALILLFQCRTESSKHCTNWVSSQKVALLWVEEERQIRLMPVY